MVSLERGASSTALGLVGTGALVLWPNQWWIGAGLILFGLGVFISGIQLRGRLWWAGHEARTIYVQNHMGRLPTQVRGEGILISQVLFWNHGAPYFGLNRLPYSERDRPEIDWGVDGAPHAQVLTLTNYGPDALVDVALEVEVVMRKQEKVEGGSQSGEEIARVELSVGVDKIGPGDERAVTIFIRNETPFFATIALRSATATPIGAKPLIVPIHTNDTGRMFALWPPKRLQI